MDHTAGPCYCRCGSRGGEAMEEGEMVVGPVGTTRERIRGEENVGGGEERSTK